MIVDDGNVCWILWTLCPGAPAGRNSDLSTWWTKHGPNSWEWYSEEEKEDVSGNEPLSCPKLPRMAFLQVQCSWGAPAPGPPWGCEPLLFILGETTAALCQASTPSPQPLWGWSWGQLGAQVEPSPLSYALVPLGPQRTSAKLLPFQPFKLLHITSWYSTHNIVQKLLFYHMKLGARIKQEKRQILMSGANRKEAHYNHSHSLLHAINIPRE